ncbi:hypothetical protein BC829DRAFT_401768 [Chytridium lagenaria]|nr:hypothetical protein BC829DRAFT_401768 [Chytridium lagenaria]
MVYRTFYGKASNTTSYLNGLFVIYVRESRLRRIFVMETIISQKLGIRKDIISSASPDEVYDICRGITVNGRKPDILGSKARIYPLTDSQNDLKSSEAGVGVEKKPWLARIIHRIVHASTLKDHIKENQYLEWQRNEATFVFRISLMTVAGNEIFHALVDPLTYCDNMKEESRSPSLCFNIAHSIMLIRIILFTALGFVGFCISFVPCANVKHMRYQLIVSAVAMCYGYIIVLFIIFRNNRTDMTYQVYFSTLLTSIFILMTSYAVRLIEVVTFAVLMLLGSLPLFLATTILQAIMISVTLAFISFFLCNYTVGVEYEVRRYFVLTEMLNVELKIEG